MKPRVTIGVCVRNSAATIHDAILSIVTQDFDHDSMEIIFVDDGSDDETLHIIQTWILKTNIHSEVFHHEWKGLGPSRNLVIEKTRGDYIIWVDGDMTIPSDHVRKQIAFMELHPRIGIAKARYASHPQEGIIGTLENSAYIAVDRKYGGQTTTRGLGTGGSIYRVEAIKKAGGFDKEMTGAGEDINAELRVRKVGWQTYLGTPAMFCERRRRSFEDILKEYYWQGYGAYKAYKKNKSSFDLFKLNPVAGFLAGTYYAIISYSLLYRKLVFLLPIEYFFKRVAWFLGFMTSKTIG